jgi:hypothetical protein
MPIPRKKRYEKPKIESEEIDHYSNVVSSPSFDDNVTRRLADGKVFYRQGRKFPQDFIKQNKIINKLNAIGVKTEQPFRNEVLESVNDYGEKRYEMLYEGAGKSVFKLWKNQQLSKKDIKEIFLQIVDIVGKMHAIGITHGHPHLNNFTVKRNNDKWEVYLIDFKKAKDLTLEKKNKRLNWKKNPFDFFMRNEGWKEDSFRVMFLLDRLFEKEKDLQFYFLKRMILHYPCNIREKLRFLKYFRNKIYLENSIPLTDSRIKRKLKHREALKIKVKKNPFEEIMIKEKIPYFYLYEEGSEEFINLVEIENKLGPEDYKSLLKQSSEIYSKFIKNAVLPVKKFTLFSFRIKKGDNRLKLYFGYSRDKKYRNLMDARVEANIKTSHRAIDFNDSSSIHNKIKDGLEYLYFIYKKSFPITNNKLEYKLQVVDFFKKFISNLPVNNKIRDEVLVLIDSQVLYDL